MCVGTKRVGWRRWWMWAALSVRTASVRPSTRASRGTAIEATVNAEHLLRRGVRRCLRTNAPLGETRGFRLRASGPGSRARAADEIPGQDQAHASTPATKLINCRSGGRWRTAYGTTYILARPDRWSRGGLSGSTSASRTPLPYGPDIYLTSPLRPCERCPALRSRRRDGGSCHGPAMPNGRCRVHSGLSTGPRTLEGLERSRGRPGTGRRACPDQQRRQRRHDGSEVDQYP